MVLHLFGGNITPCTLRVAVVLKEKGIPFEFTPVNLMTGEHKRPEYLEIHPFGKIPYINDDGFTLYESRAICRYIDAKQPGLAPKPTDDARAYALYEQAAGAEVVYFEHVATPAIVQKIFAPMRGHKPDEELVAKQLATLDTTLDAYEKILSKQKYLAGNELTLVDLFHLPEGALTEKMGYTGLTAESRPNVARWWRELSARPSWLAVQNGIREGQGM